MANAFDFAGNHSRGDRPAATDWVSLLTWDGLLPLGVTGSAVLTRLALPNADGLVMIVAFFVPMVAALARAAMAQGQLTRRFPDRVPLRRKLALAAAIVWLFLFEFLANAFIFARNIGKRDWLVPIAFYLSYLLFIVLALRPATSATVSERFEIIES